MKRDHVGGQDDEGDPVGGQLDDGWRPCGRSRR